MDFRVVHIIRSSTVHFLGNLDWRKYGPEQDVCQNDRGDPPKRKTAFFQIFTDAICCNFAVTVQIGAIWRNLPFLTSRGIFGRPTIVNTIFRIEFRVYREIFSLLGAIRVKKWRRNGNAFPQKKTDLPIICLPWHFRGSGHTKTYFGNKISGLPWKYQPPRCTICLT